jgi:hypothetical protein
MRIEKLQELEAWKVEKEKYLEMQKKNVSEIYLGLKIFSCIS